MARKRVDKLPLWLFGIILASSYYLLTSTKPKPLSGFGDDEHLGYDPLGIGEVDLANVSDGVPGGGLGQYSLTPVYGGFQSYRVSPIKAIISGALSTQPIDVAVREAPPVALPFVVSPHPHPHPSSSGAKTTTDVVGDMAHSVAAHEIPTSIINAVNAGVTISPTSATSSVISSGSGSSSGGGGITSAGGGGLRAFMQNILNLWSARRASVHGWSVNGW